ncbi:BMP family lipoprotein [Anaeromicropila populeti]|uniref:Nucleoside-binding protein n=1 Tax=Anaeromicropila populeti TaxID=37658 RepID=A0A1I6I9C7_9FIRM|nr:BMP family ABC transporter substrate-binding protein [Anaeromicropila populeti]SFR62990.1 nucleoside-binding protein [Anaeromicropila populeti]
MKKRLLALLLVLTVSVMATACGKSSTDSEDGTQTNEPAVETEEAVQETEAAATDFNVGMVTDTGGVNDKSFNQSAWEGLQQFAAETGAQVSYLESTQEADYSSNLDKQVDEGKNLIWGIGFAMADAILEAADMNPDANYAIIDNAYAETPDNLTGVVFSAQDPSFMVGYAAAYTTETNSVGFVGGMTSDVIDQFEYGYRAGVAYAAKELGKEITVDVQYAESFSDLAKGKAIATTMFSNGCDIVFHAAGGTGIGVIEAAKDAGKFAIGVDSDQSDLAPENVLTSALKRVDVAISLISKKLLEGEAIGGQTFSFGLAEGAVGIPENNPNMAPEVYEKVMAIQDKIAAGEITPPYNEETFEAFNQ